MNIVDFLNSNFLSSIITFIAACVAIFVYLKQKHDTKQEAAIIILMEIRRAERNISEFRAAHQQISALLSVLPFNSWNKLKHLFVKDLDKDEFEYLTNFYTICESIESELLKIKKGLPENLTAKLSAIQSKITDIAYQNRANPNQYQEEKEAFLKIITSEDYTFNADAPQKTFLELINLIQFVSISSVMIKFKKIAKENS